MSLAGPFTSSMHTLGYHATKFTRGWKNVPASMRDPSPYQVSRFYMSGPGGYWNANQLGVLEAQAAARCVGKQARCYDRFWSKAFNTAQVGISAWTVRESFDMISARANQLRDAVIALRRRNFRKLGRVLGINRHPDTPGAISRARRAGTSLGGQWLEFTFGWAPLVGDIDSAVRVLGQEFPAERVYSRIRAVEYLTAPNPYIISQAWWNYIGQENYFMAALVQVDNPNLLLARQLGLVNPVAIVWDVIPFSFVADWFVPVGKFINSWQDHVGIKVTGAYHGWAVSAHGSVRHFEHDDGAIAAFRFTSGDRVLGEIPRPGLMDRARLPTVEPWITATSISLLLAVWPKR